MLDLFGNIIGYCGSIICVYAYFMVQKQHVNMMVYNVLNIVASSCLLISLCIHTNIASMLLEIFWLIGAVYGVVLAVKRKKNNK